MLIIDDNKAIRQGLRLLLQNQGIADDTIFEACNVQEGIAAIKQHQPNIVFLDVEMPDGTGFDLLKSLQSIDFQLIFITAHNHYAIRAFEFSAIDFLQKPIDEDELKRALQRAQIALNRQGMELQIKILSESLQNLHLHEKKIALRDQENIYFVKIQDIIQCQANGAYTLFHFEDKKTIVVSKTLKEYEEMLAPFLFFRAHHSHLINLNKIKQFNKLESTLLMQDGSQIAVSVRKKEELLKIIGAV